MLSPLPRRSDWASSLLIHPAVSAFPDRVVGSACASTFSRFARRSLALRPAHSRCHQFVTRITEGFNRFVTSTIAPVASGWSICRVGLTPTGKRHLFTAHTRFSQSSPSALWRFKISEFMSEPEVGETSLRQTLGSRPTIIGSTLTLPPLEHSNCQLAGLFEQQDRRCDANDNTPVTPGHASRAEESDGRRPVHSDDLQRQRADQRYP